MINATHANKLREIRRRLDALRRVADVSRIEQDVFWLAEDADRGIFNDSIYELVQDDLNQIEDQLRDYPFIVPANEVEMRSGRIHALDSVPDGNPIAFTFGEGPGNLAANLVVLGASGLGKKNIS